MKEQFKNYDTQLRADQNIKPTVNDSLRRLIYERWHIDLTEAEEWLAGLLKPARFRHSVGVRQTALQMALRFGVDEDKALLAGLLHDCAKSLKDHDLLEMAENQGWLLNSLEREEPGLLHAKAGAVMASRRYPQLDEEIIDAIALHTFGGEHMSDLAKIIFLADMIEPGRNYPEVNELRELAFYNGTERADLDRCLLRAYDATIIYLVESGRKLHPQTIVARNYLLQNNDCN